MPVEVDDLLSRISTSDAVVFATPEYAGGLPVVLKNLLDWTVGGGQLYDKLVAWLERLEAAIEEDRYERGSDNSGHAWLGPTPAPWRAALRPCQ